MFRRILKNLSGEVVLKRRLPHEFGAAPMLVTPASALAYWRRDLSRVDPLLLSMARETVSAGMTVWDIGANLGLFSFAAAAIGAKVVAVEPDTWLANLIYRSRLLNGLPVTVLSAAVTDHSGISHLRISENGRSSNSLVNGAEIAQTVIAVTLDWMLEYFAPPHVLKIDVEGHEYAVLQGATKVLEARPKIFCEVTENHDEIGKLLRQANYQFYAARSIERLALSRPSRDTIALPS